MWRRSLSLALLAAWPGGAPAQAPAAPPLDSTGRLYAPQMVQQRERSTERDNDSLVKAIEGGIRCTCGCNLDVFTCRTTDFTCTTSPAMHREVIAMLDSARTPQQIVAAFEARYGQSVLMAPPKRGFNWTAYLMPFAGLLAGLGILGAVMRRWVMERAAREPQAEAEPVAGASPDELERLRRELERFEA
jgi:cytochrome c-type biogenesis protein CcmH